MNKILQIFESNKENIDTKALEYQLKDFSLKPLPKKIYIISITPRSGSSWLVNILKHQGKFGHPNEWFNPETISKNIINKYPSTNLEEYISIILSEFQSDNGIFGVKMSYYHHKLMNEIVPWYNWMKNNTSFIYLTRKDILSQAISLFRSVETGVWHSTQNDFQNLNSKNVEYNEEKIWYWIFHILYQEEGWRKFYSENNISPLKLTYEELNSSLDLNIKRIHYHILGSNILTHSFQNESNFQKLKAPESNHFALKFYEKYANEIEYCLINREIISVNEIKKEINIISN